MSSGLFFDLSKGFLETTSGEFRIQIKDLSGNFIDPYSISFSFYKINGYGKIDLYSNSVIDNFPIIRRSSGIYDLQVEISHRTFSEGTYFLIWEIQGINGDITISNKKEFSVYTDVILGEL